MQLQTLKSSNKLKKGKELIWYYDIKKQRLQASFPWIIWISCEIRNPWISYNENWRKNKF